MRGIDLVAIDSAKTAFRDDGISVIKGKGEDDYWLVISIVDVSVVFDEDLEGLWKGRIDDDSRSLLRSSCEVSERSS